MSKILTFALAAAILAGCAHDPENSFRKRTDRVDDLILRTKGDPGQAFTGILNLDGTERHISGVSPAEYEFRACVVTGTIEQTGGLGSLAFEIVSRNALVTFGPKEPGGTCQFRYHDRSLEVWQ